MRLDTAIESYLDSLAGEGRSVRTIDAYRRDLGLLVGHVGAGRDVRTIAPSDLLAFACSRRSACCGTAAACATRSR